MSTDQLKTDIARYIDVLRLYKHIREHCMQQQSSSEKHVLKGYVIKIYLISRWATHPELEQRKPMGKWTINPSTSLGGIRRSRSHWRSLIFHDFQVKYCMPAWDDKKTHCFLSFHWRFFSQLCSGCHHSCFHLAFSLQRNIQEILCLSYIKNRRDLCNVLKLLKSLN